LEIYVAEESTRREEERSEEATMRSQGFESGAMPHAGVEFVQVCSQWRDVLRGSKDWHRIAVHALEPKQGGALLPLDWRRLALMPPELLRVASDVGLRVSHPPLKDAAFYVGTPRSPKEIPRAEEWEMERHRYADIALLVSSFKRCPRLASLCLAGTTLSPCVFMEAGRHLTELRSLDLGNTTCTTTCQGKELPTSDELGTPANLELISGPGPPVFFDFFMLRAGAQLLRINLDRTTWLSDATIVVIAETAPLLEELSMRGPRRKICPLVTGTSLVAIGKGCKYLQELRLSHARVSEAGVKAISKLPLKTLELAHVAGLTLPCISALRSCKSLAELKVNNAFDPPLQILNGAHGKEVGALRRDLRRRQGRIVMTEEDPHTGSVFEPDIYGCEGLGLELYLSTLTGMGFSRSHVMKCLELTNGQLERALSFLLEFHSQDVGGEPWMEGFDATEHTLRSRFNEARYNEAADWCSGEDDDDLSEIEDGIYDVYDNPYSMYYSTSDDQFSDEDSDPDAYIHEDAIVEFPY